MTGPLKIRAHLSLNKKRFSQRKKLNSHQRRNSNNNNSLKRKNSTAQANRKLTLSLENTTPLSQEKNQLSQGKKNPALSYKKLNFCNENDLIHEERQKLAYKTKSKEKRKNSKDVSFTNQLSQKTTKKKLIQETKATLSCINNSLLEKSIVCLSLSLKSALSQTANFGRD